MAASSRIDPSIAIEIDRLATALAKDPRSKVFLPLADEYIKAGMWQEAAAVLEDGLQAYPGFVTAMAALGRVYDQLGQPVKAKAILEEVVKQRPDNLRAHRILAKIYNAEGKADLALRSCTAILSANSFDEEALSIRRSITGALNDPPQTKRDKKRAGGETRPETRKVSTSVVMVQDSTPYTAVASHEPTSEPPSEPSVTKHAATVVRLEAWLRTIQALRKTGTVRM
ncbi:MAG: tetratricopeptide repeat protein [Nitrospirota bacterium]|nr:tetratricopeptide repeat protein [Nitrospirota bacterium]